LLFQDKTKIKEVEMKRKIEELNDLIERSGSDKLKRLMEVSIIYGKSLDFYFQKNETFHPSDPPKEIDVNFIIRELGKRMLFGINWRPVLMDVLFITMNTW
jgi:hypothetical protein